MQGILVWGGCVVAFMIRGWAGVAWWLLALIVSYLCMIFRPLFSPTPRERREAREAAMRENERRQHMFAQCRWDRERPLTVAERKELER
jgi:fatty acid desaturase